MNTRSPKRQINVHVRSAFRGLAKVADVRKAASAALAVADPEGDAAVSVLIADDHTLQDLNSRFRGIDETTDVLAFGAAADPPADASDPPFPEPPAELRTLGDIVVAYPLAARQASEHNVHVKEEIALLVVHGVLHLLGYDHAAPCDEAAMKTLEAKALAAALPQRPTAHGAAPPNSRRSAQLIESAHQPSEETPE